MRESRACSEPASPRVFWPPFRPSKQGTSYNHARLTPSRSSLSVCPGTTPSPPHRRVRRRRKRPAICHRRRLLLHHASPRTGAWFGLTSRARRACGLAALLQAHDYDYDAVFVGAGEVDRVLRGDCGRSGGARAPGEEGAQFKPVVGC